MINPNDQNTYGSSSHDYDQSNNQEIVEASVVPSFSDSVKRWSEELGDRISVVSENLSHNLIVGIVKMLVLFSKKVAMRS